MKSSGALMTSTACQVTVVRGLSRRAGIFFREGLFLVIEDIEDVKQVGHSQQLADARRHVKQFQIAALIADRRIDRKQEPEAGAIDVSDAGQIQDDLPATFGGQALGQFAQLNTGFSAFEVSGSLDNDVAIHFASIQNQTHGRECIK
jgi:hypothetical protein